jgi:tripartite-type tricarboxylate transporter receptor subunit TctC
MSRDTRQALGLVSASRNGTPLAVIEKLNQETQRRISEPGIKDRLVDLGGTILGGSPADFGKLIADETEKWGKVIRTANIKPE